MQLAEIQLCGYFNSDISFPGQKITPEREVKWYEIEYVLSNGGTSVINQKEYPVVENHMIIGKPGDMRYSLLSAPFTKIFLKLSATGEMADILDALPSEFPLLHAEQIKSLMNEIVTNVNSPQRDTLYAGGKLLLLIHALSKDASFDNHRISPFYSRVHSAKKFIEAHFNEPIKTEDIAQSIFISESHFRYLFREIYGITAHSYLLQVRIEHAKKLLSTTSMSHEEIGIACHLGTQKNFITAFHKATGTTPSKFKREMAEIQRK